MVNNKLKQMREIVLAELKHIPDWPVHQGELRMQYWSLRMHSLGKKVKIRKSAKEVLDECIADLGSQYPGAEFEYNRDFFK
jgi:hypothetical protein